MDAFSAQIQLINSPSQLLTFYTSILTELETVEKDPKGFDNFFDTEIGQNFLILLFSFLNQETFSSEIVMHSLNILEMIFKISLKDSKKIIIYFLSSNGLQMILSLLNSNIPDLLASVFSVFELIILHPDFISGIDPDTFFGFMFQFYLSLFDHKPCYNFSLLSTVSQTLQRLIEISQDVELSENIFEQMHTIFSRLFPLTFSVIPEENLNPVQKDDKTYENIEVESHFSLCNTTIRILTLLCEIPGFENLCLDYLNQLTSLKSTRLAIPIFQFLIGIIPYDLEDSSFNIVMFQDRFSPNIFDAMYQVNPDENRNIINTEIMALSAIYPLIKNTEQFSTILHKGLIGKIACFIEEASYDIKLKALNFLAKFLEQIPDFMNQDELLNDRLILCLEECLDSNDDIEKPAVQCLLFLKYLPHQTTERSEKIGNILTQNGHCLLDLNNN